MIGFVADTITIISVGNADVDSPSSHSTLVIAFFVMTYVWLASGWLILLRWTKKRPIKKYTLEIEKVTLGLGAFLYPFTFLIMYYVDTGEQALAFFFLHLLSALLVYVSLRFLITSIYPELNEIMKERYDAIELNKD